MGNHQAESKPVGEPWPLPSPALLLLRQRPPSQLTGHLPSGSRRSAERWTLPGSRLQASGLFPEEILMVMSSQQAPAPSCPLGLEANSEEQMGLQGQGNPACPQVPVLLLHRAPGPSSGYQRGNQAWPDSGHCLCALASSPTSVQPGNPSLGPGAATALPPPGWPHISSTPFAST